MVIKVYVSGISASKEVKKRQQRALLILDSAQVEYEPVDITEPGREEERQWLQDACNQGKGEDDKKTCLPPQFFNDETYCGDYEAFNLAVDVDQLLPFLKLQVPPEPSPAILAPTNENGKIDADQRVEPTTTKQELSDEDKENDRGAKEAENEEDEGQVAGEVTDGAEVDESSTGPKRKEVDERNDQTQDEEDGSKKIKTEVAAFEVGESGLPEVENVAKPDSGSQGEPEHEVEEEEDDEEEEEEEQSDN